MTRIILVGAGKIADALFVMIAQDPAMEVAGFTVDRAFLRETVFHGRAVVAFEEVEQVFPPDDYALLVAIGYQGMNKLRAERCAKAKAKGYRLASWISPDAHVPAACKIGENCVVSPGAALQPYAHLEDDVFVWHNAVVGHHATIGAHGWLASNCTISSTAIVERFCFVGVNAAIGHSLTIGVNSLIGAGAVITRSTEPNGVYITGDTPRFRLDSDRFMRIARMT
jgi:sugar O-acyltransferase (sialic acid O-acetyltransferase NeuD family)